MPTAAAETTPARLAVALPPHQEAFSHIEVDFALRIS
jgi:hypothetical protein